MREPCATPVVLFLHRRADLLARVFAAVAEARPQQLFLIADGPGDGQKAACDAARAVVSRVDWPCDVSRCYAEQNLGVRQRIATGLDTVFSRVDRAIILEDDCVPAPDFFRFADALLDRYRDDERVFGIGGSTCRTGHAPSEASYYFSGYCGIWGWATWRRSWERYDPAMKSWPQLRDSRFLDAIWERRREVRYWRWILDSVYDGSIDTWDYQLFLAMWEQRSLWVVPGVNLVSNIGFGAGATNTRTRRHPCAAVPLEVMPSLRHPPEVVRDWAADDAMFRRIYRGNIPPVLRRAARHIRAVVRRSRAQRP